MSVSSFKKDWVAKVSSGLSQMYILNFIHCNAEYVFQARQVKYDLLLTFH